ncbi:MAG: COX15/CtaA family protein [Aeromicrobium sp.]|uniref:COX15/CtaA family protein n=1 Tax=Aeromicrobium sp. TaxID=1871063 RepID=UPI0039E6B1D2
MNVKFWARASVVANTVIILTGGLVRLTGSGLGCSEWPKCTEESWTAHKELGVHGAIEFGNRLLTYVLIAVAIATFMAIWQWSRTSYSLRWHAGVLAVGIPFQGVIGGITVLTDLNPWIVALHLLLSMALVAGSVWLVHRVSEEPATPLSPRLHTLVWAVYGTLLVAIYLGTIVTGSGPHAGDEKAPRNGLDPATWSRIHALSVWLLIGLTVLLLILLRSRIVALLLVAELAQGLIGYVQYFTDLPIALVAAHLVGAAVLLAVATKLVVGIRREPTRRDARK